MEKIIFLAKITKLLFIINFANTKSIDPETQEARIELFYSNCLCILCVNFSRSG